MRNFLLFFLVLFLNACAHKPFQAHDCFVGEVSPKNKSYLQVCFVGPLDDRGKFIFYSMAPVNRSSGIKQGLLCKQKFNFVREGNAVFFQSEINGQCGIRDRYKGASEYKVISGHRYKSGIEECNFKNKNILSCEYTEPSRVEIFHKVKSKNE